MNCLLHGYTCSRYFLDAFPVSGAYRKELFRKGIASCRCGSQLHPPSWSHRQRPENFSLQPGFSDCRGGDMKMNRSFAFPEHRSSVPPLLIGCDFPSPALLPFLLRQLMNSNVRPGRRSKLMSYIVSIFCALDVALMPYKLQIHIIINNNYDPGVLFPDKIQAMAVWSIGIVKNSDTK